VVDTVEVIPTHNVAKRMHIVKIKYFNDRFDTEVETEGEGDEIYGEA
jgi:hypothetical protein